MKKITPARRRSLDEEKRLFRAAVAVQRKFLVCLLTGLPGTDVVGDGLRSVVAHLSATYDLDTPDGTLHDLHALAVDRWNEVAPRTSRLTLVGARVVSIKHQDVGAGESSTGRFVVLLGKALSRE